MEIESSKDKERNDRKRNDRKCQERLSHYETQIMIKNKSYKNER